MKLLFSFKQVDPRHVSRSGASEYEIYYNFAFQKTNQLTHRPLKFQNVSSIEDLPAFCSMTITFAGLMPQV